jgi:hypothetical protein
MAADIGTLTPEQMLQQQQILRQQKMAEMLLQQGMEQPQGKMISGHYVKPSIFQNLAGLANTYVGQRGIEKADQAQLELAKAIREQQNVAVADYMGQMQGKPAIPEKVTEMAGPYMDNIPKPTATIPEIPAVPANPKLANLNAALDDRLPSFLRQHAMTEVTKGPKYKEISQYNQQTGNTENYRYDENSTDPRSTLQFLGISKPAMTQAETIRLKDEGLLPAGSGNMSLDGGNAPTGGGAPMGNNAPIGGVSSPANPSVKPVSAKNDDVVNQFGYDPFATPKPPPTLTTGPQIRKFYADQATPLPAESQKTVKGAINYQKAVGDLQDEFAKYTDVDLAKPTVRAKLQQKLTNAYLLGKEANTLGALTGPDLGLLEKLVTDPTAFSSLILDRKTINSLYDAQRKSAADTIRESYRLDLKPVPQDLRNHILIKPKEMPTPQTDIKSVLKAQNIPYDPSYEYKVNLDGTVDRRKKK